MSKSTLKAVGKTIDALVALNTLHALHRAGARGIYSNSPDSLEFDGSAEGYWERVAMQLGATAEEIAHARDVMPGQTVKQLERDLETARSVERGLRADLAGQLNQCNRLRGVLKLCADRLAEYPDAEGGIALELARKETRQ